MSELDDTIKLLAPGIIGTLSGVLVGYWLSTASMERSARRAHRKDLRQIKARFVHRHSHYGCKESMDTWWITAVEDYGFFRRWHIPRLIASLKDIEFPEPEWDRHLESSGTPEQYERYEKKHSAAVKRFLAAIDSIIFWA